jgi:hypothetical protein
LLLVCPKRGPICKDRDARLGWDNRATILKEIRYMLRMNLRLGQLSLVAFAAAMLLCVVPSAVADQPAQNRNDEAGATYFQQLNRVDLVAEEKGIVRVSVRGVVRDMNGAPVAGATVALREVSLRREIESFSRPIEDQKRYLVDDILARTTSAKDGAYEFVQVPTSKRDSQPPRRGQRLEVLAASEDGRFGWCPIERSEMLEIERDQHIKLRDTKPIRGTLLSPLGDPVAGVTVLLGTLDPVEGKTRYFNVGPDRLGVFRSSFMPRVRTDARGRFEFPAVPVGMISSIVAQHSQYGSFFQRIATEAEIEIAKQQDRLLSGTVANPATMRPLVTRPVVASGVVLSEDGKPLSGLQVGVGSHVEIGNPFRYTLTDDDGRFKYPMDENTQPNLIDGESKPIRVVVRDVRRAEYLPITISYSEEQLLAPGGVRIKLKKGVVIRGKVLTRDDQRPVVGVRIFPSVTDPFMVTDQAGRYRLVVPPGKHQLRFYCPSGGFDLPTRLWKPEQYPIADKLFSIPVDTTDGRSKVLPPLLVQHFTPLVALCKDSQGKPVENAAVSAIYVPLPEDFETKPLPFGSRREQSLAHSQRSDRDGSCKLQVFSGTWQRAEVRAELTRDGVRLSGRSELGPTLPQTPVSITLDQPWTLSGRVMVDGIAKQSVFVQLRRASVNVDAGPTDENGEYRFSVTAGDDYSVAVESPIGESQELVTGAAKPVGDRMLKVETIEFKTSK